MRLIRCAVIYSIVFLVAVSALAQQKDDGLNSTSTQAYHIGISDVLEIEVIRPEQLSNTATVSPDGSISFPYIGAVQVKGLTLMEVQGEIQRRLANGYMKYPVVSVSLKTSRSKNFFVYGEVVKPGAYAMDENLTVLKSISMAGGFTKFGSSNNVKVLRQSKGQLSYETIKINIDAIIHGKVNEDVAIQEGDIVVVSEGIF